MKSSDLNERRILSTLAKYRSVIFNSFWSLGGTVVPLVVALICIPLLLKLLGEEGFGFLAIAWMLVGYFSLFDFGIGRGLTYIVSRNLAKDIDSANVISSGLKVLFLLGLIVALLLFSLADWIAHILVSDKSQPLLEYSQALGVLAVAIPSVIVTAGIKGVLEANGRFRQISLITIPMGSLMFIAPLVVAYQTTNMVLIFVSLVVVRVVQTALFWINAKRNNFIKLEHGFSLDSLREVFVFSGWITISNVISPLMAYMDRFIIGAKLGLEAVSFYVVPFDMISRVKIVPRSIVSILFPHFTKVINSGERDEALSLMKKAMVVIGGLLAIPLVTVAILSEFLLTLWIDADFAQASAEILRVLCVGFLFNCLAFVPFGYVQSLGRSDITAYLHLAELILYLPFLFYMLSAFGIYGAAIAWSARVFVDFLLLLFMAYRVPRLM